MNAFSAEWSQHHGFDPKTEDLLRLLKHYSPLEIVFAYEYLCHGKKKKIPTNQIAVFFNRTAAKIIQDRGIRGEFGLIHPLGQLVRDEDPSHWGSNFNSVQAQWCAVFDQPPPWLFWTSEELDDDMRIWVAFHFYDPECRRDWVRLQIDQGLLPELRESESESKTIQHFVDWVYRCVGWGPPEKAITLALRNYEKEIIATAWTLYLEDHHKSLDDAKAFWIGGKINQWIGRARRKKQEEKENPDAEKHAREAAEKKRLADAAEAETRIQVEAEQKAQWAREAPAREAKAAEEKAFREKVNETMSKVQGWNQDSDGNWRHNRVVYRVGASSVSEVNAVGSLPIAIEELEKWARSEVGLKSKEAS